MLTGLADKVISWGSITKVQSFLNIFNTYVKTDMGLKDMLYFATQGMKLNTSSAVSSATLEGRGDAYYRASAWCMELNQESTVKLVNELVKIRVRPYYIYQCDLSMGLEHFRTPVSKGIEIIEGLRGHTSGFCVPTFVVDAPGGGGKTPVMPQYIISQTPKKVILRNYEGVITTYTEPEHYTDCQCDYCTGKKKKELMGVAGLERGQALSMEPANLERHKRSHHEE